MRYWEAMYPRADPPEDSEAELALLRDARLAAIPSDLGHYARGRARPLICSSQWPTIKVWNRRCQWQRCDSHYLAASPWS